MAAINNLSVPKSSKSGFWFKPVNTEGFWWDDLELFGFMSVMMVQTKSKLNNAELLLKLYSEQRNWKQKVLRNNKRT